MFKWKYTRQRFLQQFLYINPTYLLFRNIQASNNGSIVTVRLSSKHRSGFNPEDANCDGLDSNENGFNDCDEDACLSEQDINGNGIIGCLEKGCEDICKEAYSCAIDHLEELPDNTFEDSVPISLEWNEKYDKLSVCGSFVDHNGENELFDRYELPTLEAGHDLIIDVSIEHNDSQTHLLLICFQILVLKDM